MAVSILAAMNADAGKSVHPFFNKASTKLDFDHLKSDTEPREEPDHTPSEQHGGSEEKPKRTRSKRKPKDGKPMNQPTLADIVNPKPEVVQPATVTDQGASESNVQDERRKRRRTSQSEAVHVGTEEINGNGVLIEASEPVVIPRSSPQVIIPRSSPLPRIPPLEETIAGDDGKQVVTKTPPRKILKLNANGRFSSPPAKACKADMETSIQIPPLDSSLAEHPSTVTPPRKVLKLKANGRFSSPPTKNITATESDAGPSRGRLRPRKPAGNAPEKQFLVTVSYGLDGASQASVGEKINAILAGNVTVTVKKKPSPRKRTPQKPRKSTHPFFTGKHPPTLSVPKPESPRKTSAITPGKLRVKAFSERVQDIKEVEFSSALLKDRLMVKHPGAKEAPFPEKDQAHVRGEAFQIKQPMCGVTFDLLFNPRKHKQALVPVTKDESVLARFASRLTIEEDLVLRKDGFHEPSRTLSVPDRLLISGEEIAQRISGQLSVPITHIDQDELSSSPAPLLTSSPYSRRPSQDSQTVHSALSRLYDRIPDTLTAFDECRGEALGWAHKYAPKTSADVLQPDNEVRVLRDWLQSLAVQTVSGAVNESRSVEAKPAEKPKRKRKKKADDLDDFLVDSDEDLREMNELPLAAPGIHPGSQKTQVSIVQSVSENVKLSNTVLLSGPHGCGKTAAAYAVAKELGFKIFEISSSERRSGRDVLEKVGDMTENHMVKHHGVESTETPPLEPSHIDEAFQRDLESGRQGTMNAFFKPKPAKPKATEPRKMVREKKMKAVQEAIKKPSKEQQQSLILLEEVDILFRDDKEFWTTVIKLIMTSKRPFIMTCNDENVLPLRAITLHAILRLKPPPPELATDYMLLLAAAEGHLLKRDAVASLYSGHNRDLRASITELDYWCQMGVGDPREGLGWIYQRYPPGSDLDEQGRKLRVVSVNTYQTSMSLSSEDGLDTESTLHRAWDDFNVHPATALGWEGMSDEAHANLTIATSKAQNHRKSLNVFTRYADALSAADVCSANGISGTAPFDPTQPDLTETARGNYIIGHDLLQTNESIDYLHFGKDLLIAMTITAHRAYSVSLGLGNETTITKALARNSRARSKANGLTRQSFACFDPIANSSELSLNNNPGLMQSVFDGTFKTIALDLAPYVRSIVQFDKALEEQRARLSLLNSDGRSSKRQRTTRAARSALEGGQRATTRKERWFANELDLEAVLATGGEEWPRFAQTAASMDAVSKDGTDGMAPASSADSA